MDQALNLHGFEQYRRKHDLSGAGVVVGVVDSGVDGGHPAFAGRLQPVLDQFDGRVISPSEATDEDGHGTHVAAIAAGGEPDPFTGVAPESMLVVVKSDLQTARVGDGISWIFDQADRLGVPAVVNVSAGGHWDPHDGTADLDLEIDSLSGPGRIVVVAAGNSGREPIHTHFKIKTNGLERVGLFVEGTHPRLRLHLWYDGRSAIDCMIVSPSGQRTEWCSPSDLEPWSQFLLGSAATEIMSKRTEPSNSDSRIAVEVRDGEIEKGRWELRLRCKGGDSIVHAWIDPFPIGPGPAWEAPTQSHLVGSPGAARSAITVGAYVSRTHWTDTRGRSNRYHPDAGYTIGDVAPFSSPGPLRQAHEKPDIGAAGAMVVSALSSSLGYEPPGEYVVDDRHIAMEGTSMAAPVITGLVATALQRHPKWAPDDVRSWLRAAARGTYNPLDGQGLVAASALG